ncbi:hypothetical protein NUU61_003706 [Penicillium alfredii]|uniref:Uncharacterized protein n=1 Tax=Penicillium alfredii TaxID=1506179 RepID=A0A9W9FJR2_9EURO|nr:uncharacterized protein NUU61_003706 [Penicillium alfredii]KAJ5101484.1 hypothetical protein NUU61_003706 [Penicillium alfredii]
MALEPDSHGRAGVETEKELAPEPTPTDEAMPTDEGVSTDEPQYPVHPIPQLQAPFEESIIETNEVPPEDRVVSIDVQSRRRDLLENDEYERLCGRKWRQRDTERYHPFWKLVSQMVFGVHLLAKRIAISEVEVMKILQTHVDELDGFLQRTTEDFLIIRLDVRTRIHYLSLPLQNLAMFDEMLEDRNFRLAIVAYNDQIEHAIKRFTMAITDSLKDARKGKEAMGALWHYLRQRADEGCFESESLTAFYQAMTENMEGWVVALAKLRRRGAGLQKALGQLGLAVTEMQRRVGVASRKDLRSFMKMANRSAGRNSVRQRLFTKGLSTPASRPKSDKPLPRDPLSKSSKSPKPSKPANNPTASKQLSNEPATKQSGPDPNNAKVTSDMTRPKILSRAKSCSALVGEPGAGAAVSNMRIPGRLTRKLSKTFLLSRQSLSDLAQSRPATAPPRSLRPSRSISFEHLRAFATGRPRSQHSTAKPPTRQADQQQPDHRETMKSQISHFLKRDRVVEAWDNMAKKPGCCGGRFARSRDWPCSIFRTKPSNDPQAHAAKGKEPNLSGPEMEKQMSWAPGAPDALNTYSIKDKREVSPRIHVLSVQTGLDENSGARRERDGHDADNDASSAITALPSLAPRSPLSVPSIPSEQPRSVSAQA